MFFSYCCLPVQRNETSISRCQLSRTEEDSSIPFVLGLPTATVNLGRHGIFLHVGYFKEQAWNFSLHRHRTLNRNELIVNLTLRMDQLAGFRVVVVDKMVSCLQCGWFTYIGSCEMSALNSCAILSQPKDHIRKMFR